MIRQGVEWAVWAGYGDVYGTFFAMVVAALIIGVTPLGRPLQWAETFYHEFSHGLACLLSFGRIHRIRLKFNGAGLCETYGGSRVFILLMGYTGAALWGGMLYLVGWVLGKGGATLWLQLELGLLALVTVFWVRDLQTLIIMLILGAIYAAGIIFPSAEMMPWILQFLGIFVMLNAIKAPLNLLDGQHKGDGAMLADTFMVIPEFVWAGLWFAIGVLVMLGCMALTLPGFAVWLRFV